MKLVCKLLLVVSGIALLAAATSLAVSKRAFVRNAERVQGRVVGLNAGGSHPQIEFTAKSGERLNYSQGGMIFGCKPGDVVQVLYDSANPAGTACIGTVGALWAAPIFLSLTGFILILVAISQR